jgi:hypothetical protein
MSQTNFMPKFMVQRPLSRLMSLARGPQSIYWLFDCASLTGEKGHRVRSQHKGHPEFAFAGPSPSKAVACASTALPDGHINRRFVFRATWSLLVNFQLLKMSKLNLFVLAFVGLVAVASAASLPLNFQQLPEQLKEVVPEDVKNFYAEVIFNYSHLFLIISPISVDRRRQGHPEGDRSKSRHLRERRPSFGGIEGQE